MEMSSDLQIALRVAGTKQRRAGFAPLVSVGVLAGDEGANMYRSTMVAERPVYVVKHTGEYILYQLIDRGVKPFDADANGVLSIALTISRRAQLADKNNPYALLNEVYKRFVESYMEPTSDGRLSFLDIDIDNEEFREIVGRYKLEARKSHYVVMAQQGLTGIICVPHDKLPDFFANTQYKEFAPFKDIEVGVSCGAQVTPGLEELQIPLPLSVYDVWVNGQPMGVSMQSPTDTYTAQAESTKFYTYDSVDFILDELFRAPMNRIFKKGATISLDLQRNRINCELKKNDIYYTLEYIFKDNVGGAISEIDSCIRRGDVKLYIGSVDISSSVWTNDKIKASDIKGQNVEIKPTVVGDYSLLCKSQTYDASRLISTTITINRRAIPNRPTSVRSSKSTAIRPSSNVEKKDIVVTSNQMKQNKGVPTESFMPDDRWIKDMKSFVFGVILGLGIGLGIWGSFSMLKKDLNRDTTEGNNDAQVDSTQIDNTADVEPRYALVNDTIAEKQDNPSDSNINPNPKSTVDTDSVRLALIRYVGNRPTLKQYQQHGGYKHFNTKEKYAIEAYLNPGQYENKLNSIGKMALHEITGRTYEFNSMKDIYEVQKRISKVIEEKNNKMESAQ